LHKIGILGGTFNPIHIGHLLAAQTVREACGLERVLLLPCHTPPHKGCGVLAPVEDRVAMVRLAAANDPGLEISTLEVERGGVSYAVDTLQEFRRRYPDCAPHFIIGMDSLRELHLWHRVEELLPLCRFVTVARPGVDRPLRPEELALPVPWPERLLADVIPGRLCEVSSREIRQRVARRLPIRYLVPAAVEEYILARGLYAQEAAAAPARCAAQGERH
jgi:nicotinate-nucleotide adenylyltransferase